MSTTTRPTFSFTAPTRSPFQQADAYALDSGIGFEPPVREEGPSRAPLDDTLSYLSALGAPVNDRESEARRRLEELSKRELEMHDRLSELRKYIDEVSQNPTQEVNKRIEQMRVREERARRQLEMWEGRLDALFNEARTEANPDMPGRQAAAVTLRLQQRQEIAEQRLVEVDRELKERQAELDEANRTWDAKYAKLKEEIVEHETKNNSLKSELSALQAGLAAIAAETAEAKSLISGIEDKKQQLSVLVDSVAQERRRLNELRQQNKTLVEESAEATAKMTEAKEAYEKLSADHAQAKIDIKRMEDGKAFLDKLASEIVTHENRAKDLVEVVENWTRRSAELEARHKEIRTSSDIPKAVIIGVAKDIAKRVAQTDSVLKLAVQEKSSQEVIKQIDTIGSSLRDILLMHGVEEFSIAPDTEVDSELRRKITIIDEKTGSGKTRIKTMLKPGFHHIDDKGNITIITKPEVTITSEA